MNESEGAVRMQKLHEELRAANTRLGEARAELADAQKAQKIANARHKRQYLWIRADELRKQLAEVESEAANITL